MWLGGIQNSEWLIFGDIESVKFDVFSHSEFLCRSLIVPDAATAGSSSTRLCVDRACMSRFDASVLRVTVIPNYTIHVWSGIQRVVFAIGGLTLGAWFACTFIGDDAVAEQSLFAASKRGGSYMVMKLTTISWI